MSASPFCSCWPASPSSARLSRPEAVHCKARTDYVYAGDGRTLAFVTGLIPCPLTTFILSYALTHGLLAAGLAVTAAMAAGMIATIASVAVLATLFRERLLSVLARTERFRVGVGRILEIGGAGLVVLLGVWTLLRAQNAL
ncbi:MAG TPA: hypothetical protein VMW57_09660 [Methyloceanibacter sp.]|nr:hypothetical protein [Methyloceanibacter sp.]